jgi:hypothetical protein
MSKKQRNLDGVYFRVKRDGKWEIVCYSDMEQQEREEVVAARVANRTPEGQAAWWHSLADILADQLYDMGEELGVVRE